MTEKKWAANEEAPLTRDQQIELMITAKERREDHLRANGRSVRFNKKTGDLKFVQERKKRNR
jgi:hypothetical protein